MTAPTYADNVPLYARIAGVVRQRIETGELDVGTMLPTLEEFMAEFGASRVTMRLAMDMLEDEQLIARRRGFGTLVISRPLNAHRVALPATWDELMSRLPNVKRTLLAVEDDATPTADELNIDERELPVAKIAAVRDIAALDAALSRERVSYVRMVARHEHAGTAYCHVDAWIDASIYKTSKSALKNQPALSVLVEKHKDRVAKVTQSMTLGLADIEVAKSLNIAMGSPIALVRRTVFDRKGERVYASRIHFPASVVRLDATLFQHKV
jgi:GntR family transcriptional regulator